MEADLQRYYCVRLSALGTPELTWRRLGVLLRGLPPDSATAIAVHGPKPTLEDRLLATIADRLAAANWQRAGKGRRPKPILFPGDEEPGTETIGKAIPIAEAHRILTNWGRNATEYELPEEVR